jgi:hypothetical protein
VLWSTCLIGAFFVSSGPPSEVSHAAGMKQADSPARAAAYTLLRLIRDYLLQLDRDEHWDAAESPEVVEQEDHRAILILIWQEPETRLAGGRANFSPTR